MFAWVLFVLITPIPACIWDTDTLRAEVEGLPGVLEIITGRFERNPPLYYEMRMDRQIMAIEANTDDLAAYDDVGAALDRLHRDDEAIAWMDKKRARLESLGDLANMKANDPAKQNEYWTHVYRYYANIGTFRLIRWLRGDHDPAQLDQMRQARDEIARAIEINPDAHFGREKYQLMFMEWIIEIYSYPSITRGADEDSFSENPFPKMNWTGNKQDAINGLTGVIALGEAWGSPDIFYTLVDVAERGQSTRTLAFFSKLRLQELILSGARSVAPGSPEGADLLALMRGGLDKGVDKGRTLENFTAMRKEADEWHARRTHYMLERLRIGKHPDVEADFWVDFDPGTPVPPWDWTKLETVSRDLKRRGLPPQMLVFIIFVGLLSVGVSIKLYQYRAAHMKGRK